MSAAVRRLTSRDMRRATGRVVSLAARGGADANGDTRGHHLGCAPDHTGDVVLSELEVGSSGVIVGFSSALRPEVARRLFDLGFVPGVEVTVVRRAPAQDPVVFRADGVDVALRCSEACGVLVAAGHNPDEFVLRSRRRALLASAS